MYWRRDRLGYPNNSNALIKKSHALFEVAGEHDKEILDTIQSLADRYDASAETVLTQLVVAHCQQAKEARGQ